MIYLDYSATTPINDEVLESYIKTSKQFIGNPNSLHKLGLESKKIIDIATEQIEKILNIKNYDIIYTSGATESNNLALIGYCLNHKNRGNKIITTKLEHSSISETIQYLEKQGFIIEYVELDKNGRVDLFDLENRIDDKTLLVTICGINSEIGIIQDIKKISQITKKKNIIFHSDLTQLIGKIKIDFNNVDMFSMSSQKIYGIKGMGILFKRKKIDINPIIYGGKSTTIFRAGTPNTAGIVSTSKAIRLIYENIDKNYEYVTNLNKYLINKLKELDVYINSNDYSSPYIINISLKNIKSETMLHALELDNIYVSTYTACSKEDYSKVIYGLTKDINKAKSSIRISLSYQTTKDEIDKLIESLKINIEKLQLK